jgi:hypothetical protein
VAVHHTFCDACFVGNGSARKAARAVSTQYAFGSIEEQRTGIRKMDSGRQRNLPSGL